MHGTCQQCMWSEFIFLLLIQEETCIYTGQILLLTKTMQKLIYNPNLWNKKKGINCCLWFEILLSVTQKYQSLGSKFTLFMVSIFFSYLVTIIVVNSDVALVATHEQSTFSFKCETGPLQCCTL